MLNSLILGRYSPNVIPLKSRVFLENLKIKKNLIWYQNHKNHNRHSFRLQKNNSQNQHFLDNNQNQASFHLLSHNNLRDFFHLLNHNNQIWLLILETVYSVIDLNQTRMIQWRLAQFSAILTIKQTRTIKWRLAQFSAIITIKQTKNPIRRSDQMLIYLEVNLFELANHFT